MKIEIKSRFTDDVLFAHEAETNSVRITLEGANLEGTANLIGDRPCFQIGPIGVRAAYFMAYLTDKGLRLQTGCFFGTREEFEAKLQAEHGDNLHAQEYRAALALIDVHAALWAPKGEVEREVDDIQAGSA
jgi:hypothetical protein